jgi:hypothetical protein
MTGILQDLEFALCMITRNLWFSVVVVLTLALGISVIVNERFARKYWPSANPFGKRLRIGDEKSPWSTVVGVSPNALQAWSVRSGEVRPLV